MNKRPPPAARTGAAPPLPAGRPPAAADAAQQASISAAWAAYYAQMSGAAPAAAGQAQQPGANAGANAAQYQNYGYGAGAAPALQTAMHGGAAAGGAYAPQAAVGPQAFPAQAYAPQQAYNPQQAQAPYMQPGYPQQPGMQQGFAQPQQPQAQAGYAQPAPMQAPYQQAPMNGYQQGAAWHQPGGYAPAAPAPAPMQNRPPGPNGNFGGPGPRPMRPNNPTTPNQGPGPQAGGFGGQYSPAGGFAPQGPRPPMRPPQNAGPPGQGFPPSKRPRTDGPPMPGPGPGIAAGPGPGPAPHNPSMSSNRGGGPPGVGGRGGFHGDHDRRDYPAPPASDFGGSQHSGHGGSARGAPRGRGAPPIRGAPAGRGGRGGFGGYESNRIPPGSANRGRGGAADRGSFRGGRGGPPQHGTKPFSANGPRAESNTPRGARDARESRPVARNGTPSKSASGDTPSKPRASSREREQDRIKEDERTRKLKEEARRRTFTDFRIVGLEIKSLDWQWGEVRTTDSADDADDEVNGDANGEADDDSSDEDEEAEADAADRKRQAGSVVKSEQQMAIATESATKDDDETDLKVYTEESAENKAADTITEEAVVVKEEKQSDPTKRGEKRKAKMSSPDADDDALVSAKKRPHIDEVKTENAKPASGDKNRFRIYFDSPVAPFVPAPRPIKRKADVSDDQPRNAPKVKVKQEAGKVDSATEVEDSDGAVAQAERITETNPDGLPEPAEGEGEGYEDVAGEEEIDEQLDGAVEETEAGDNLDAPVASEDAGDGEMQPTDEAAATEVDPEQVATAPAEAALDEPGDVSMAGSHAGEGELETADQANPTSESEVSKEQSSAARGAAAQDEPGPTALAEGSSAAAVDLTPEQIAKAAAEEAERVAKALKESAANTTAAYASKASKASAPEQKGKKFPQDFREEGFRRSPSLPPTEAETPLPAPGRLSILYDNGLRRMCLDAAVVEKIRIFRGKGLITVALRVPDAKATANKIKQISEQTEKMEVGSKDSPADAKAEESKGKSSKTKAKREEPPSWGLAKGLLLETLDEKRGLFTQMTREALLDLWEDTTAAVQSCPPPLHRVIGQDDGDQVIDLVAYLDRDRPLTEPKWVKTGHIDEWIHSITGNTSALQARKSDPALTAWDNKVEIVDPDAAPTIESVLDTWVNRTKDKTQLKTRKRFIQTQFGSMGNVVQILLRLIRGESQKAVVPRAQLSSLHGPLATAIKPNAPFADQQTHATLAVLAVVNMAREYAEKSGEKVDVLDGKMAEIIKSLPNNLIFTSVDRLYTDWVAKSSHKKGRR